MWQQNSVIILCTLPSKYSFPKSLRLLKNNLKVFINSFYAKLEFLT